MGGVFNGRVYTEGTGQNIHVIYIPFFPFLPSGTVAPSWSSPPPLLLPAGLPLTSTLSPPPPQVRRHQAGACPRHV